jgi:hypothetical protein
MRLQFSPRESILCRAPLQAFQMRQWWRQGALLDRLPPERIQVSATLRCTLTNRSWAVILCYWCPPALWTQQSPIISSMISFLFAGVMGLSSRVRSSNTLQLDAMAVASSQDSSPVSDTCHSAPGGVADTYVLLKRVSHAKQSSLNVRTPAHFLRSFSSLQRRLLWLVLTGLLLGGTMHGFVLWRGLAWQRAVEHSHRGAHPALTIENLEMGTVGRAVSMAPPNARDQAQKLGMPGDSDRLPNQPVWDAKKWNFTAKIDPDSEEWPNTVAICAMMKTEHPDDVVQWLKYHACAPHTTLSVVTNVVGPFREPCGVRERRVGCVRPCHTPDSHLSCVAGSVLTRCT